MEPEELKNFITSLIPVILKAGEVALSSQGKVKNIGKEAETLEGDLPQVTMIRQAKTVVDEQIQEILLQKVLEITDVNEVKLDAEEVTPTAKLFTDNNASITLIIDPIDGTLEYIQGHDDYSICTGLVNNGEIITALVYFPARKTLYFIDYDGKPYQATYDNSLKLISKDAIHPPTEINNKNIYVAHRVSLAISSCLINKDYNVIHDIKEGVTWTEGLLKCLSGKYYVCLFHTPQIRDVLLGAVIQKGGGYALDWNGNKLIWPDGGRIPRVLFGFKPLTDNLLNCLKEN